VRIEADGKRTVGRFVNREFRAAKSAKKSRTITRQMALSK